VGGLGWEVFICGACGEWGSEERMEDWLVIFFQLLKDIGDYFSLDLRFCK